jgi:hypothetical protein
MKNKHSQDFLENSDENPSDNSDLTLVNFLKQNKPIAPSPAPNFEQQLFTEISKYPQRSPKPLKSSLQRWLPWALFIPTVIATGLTFNWVNNRSQYQVANVSSQSQLVSEADKAAIEQSLINSWDATNLSVSQVTNTATASSDTQLLMDLSPLEYE